MRQALWFFRTAQVCAVVAAAVPGRAQQAAQEPAQQAEQKVVQEAVQKAAPQGLIGTVSLEDAMVTGAVSSMNDRATLAGNGTVVAKDHVAYVVLARGGSVRVCATSGLHLTTGAPADSSTAVASPPTPPLMLSLDRGALEVRMNATVSDLLMTPDLRIGFSEAGALDLRVRVTRNGDTCVENRVAGLNEHPTLRVASLFGDETYNILPGQHVLFERASLREVVDNESSPCGCPEVPATPPVVAASDQSLKPGDTMSSTQAESQHPFPAAVSQGLAPPPEVPQAPPGVEHTQVSTTMTYSSADAYAAAKKNASASPAATANPAGAGSATLPAAEKKRGLFHAIGRFFSRVFERVPES